MHVHLPILTIFMAALLICTVPLSACKTVGPPEARVAVASESAIIVWNAATHMEHFIRRADFNSNSPNFGFLVPTPSPPTLAESNDGVFQLLEATYHPPQRVHNKHRLVLAPFMMMLVGSKRQTAPAPSVEVVGAQRVAGYDAVVLKAGDPVALAGWLKQHGYQSDSSLIEWLHPYIARHWTITAFKVAKPNPNSPQSGLTPVRMSFQTNRPFYPYRESADQRVAGAYEPKRRLRIFYLSDQRVEGTLDRVTTPWPGHPVWAEPYPTAHSSDIGLITGHATGLEGKRRDLATSLGLARAQLPAAPWLTVFEDKSSPRPGIADLYFRSSPQQTMLAPPPVDVQIISPGEIPAELVVIGLFIGIKTVRRRYTPNEPALGNTRARRPTISNSRAFVGALLLTAVITVFLVYIPVFI